MALLVVSGIKYFMSKVFVFSLNVQNMKWQTAQLPASYSSFLLTVHWASSLVKLWLSLVDCLPLTVCPLKICVIDPINWHACVDRTGLLLLKFSMPRKIGCVKGIYSRENGFNHKLRSNQRNYYSIHLMVIEDF